MWSAETFARSAEGRTMPGLPHPSEQFRSLGLMYQLVGEFVAPIAVGLVVDWLAKTGPWGTIVGALLGMAVGGWHLLRIASRIGNQPPKPPDGSP
jgi:F0F1-type ATP synthase assembly protein I